MNIEELRLQIEEDLSWRLDELRHLRNELLGNQSKEDWPVAAIRALLVMQYAHLEGFARNAFSLYVDAVNAKSLVADQLKPNLFASACLSEFDALRLTNQGDQEGEETRLTRRAKVQVEFVNKIRSLNALSVSLDADAVVSMEMNFGTDVFRRTLYRLGIPEENVDKSYYSSLEFVRRARNDIAHGNKKERIEPGMFEAHSKKCEKFMGDLTRLITLAVSQEWFRSET